MSESEPTVASDGDAKPPAEPATTRPRRRPAWLPIALVVAVIGGGVWLWEDVIEDRVVPKRWGVVVPDAIYRSGQLHPALLGRTLTDHDIELVISLRGEDDPDPSLHREVEITREMGIERLVFPLHGDGTGNIEQYAQAIAAMHAAREAKRPTVVHCAAGSQRTGGVVACYRMLIEGVSPAVAYADLEMYDWDPEGDQVLLEYVNAHMAELVARLIELDVLRETPDPLPVLGP